MRMCHRSACRRPGFESAHITTRLLLIMCLISAGSLASSQTLEPLQNSTNVTGTVSPDVPSMPSALAQSALPAPTIASAAAAAGSAPNSGPQLSADYDYVDPAPAVNSQSAPSVRVTTPRPSVAADNSGLFYPLYGPPSPVGGGATQPGGGPMTALANPLGQSSGFPMSPGVGGPESQFWGERGWRGGEMGEQSEWLRERLRKLWKFHGNSPVATAQLEVLQKQFPGVNITQMYNSPAMYGEDGYRGYYGESWAKRFGPGYGEGYGERYGEGYGRPYGEGYGMNFGDGYGRGYGEGYGEDWYYYNGTWYPNYEFEDWYYHNGTWHQSLGDWEDGYFHNGTWYPGMDEMDEWYYHNGTWYPSMGDWEDGYFHNGTWYPGLEDMMEDGYFYNGTWYPGMGDLEDGYYFNGTWYPGYEREDVYEREGPEREDLMWWQLHHPRWSGQETSQQGPPYAQVPPISYPNAGSGGAVSQLPSSPQQRLLILQQLRPQPQSLSQNGQPKGQGNNPFVNMLRNQPAQNQRRVSPEQRQSIPGKPKALPVTQQASSSAVESGNPQFNRRRPPPPGYVPRRDRINQRLSPTAARMTGRRPPPPPPLFRRRRPPPPNWKPPTRKNQIINLPPKPNPGLSPSGQQARVTGMKTPQEEVKIRPSSPLDPYRSTATVTMGIVIACLIGLVLILAPLLCLLHKYRQEKRVKKRTFLRRAEHGSIDEGIMDAMVMSELGERRGSRVTKVGAKGGKTVWKGARPKTGKAAGNLRDFPEMEPMQTMTRSDKELAELYSVIP